ncbi:MAG TPA: glutaredoxin family protein [Planctomycetota bacterium]|nr:glutaredoxin family protein [Planctomycetota bacterium]
MRKPGNGFPFLLLLFAACSARAGMYKWIDENGYIHYADKPPEAQQKTLEITGRISSYDSPEILPENSGEKPESAANKPAKNKRVVMYSAEWCGVCRKAKQYFAEKHISYTDYDIDTDPKGKADYENLDAHGVPVILVGNRRMNGFSAGGFEQLYYGE